uniref:Dolichyl-diphosphooligosaccharide--protein glycosyltransferase subunit DAD1 n=1 Tax=Chrysemys picta bellii TaxID=8478 RepID=A0A8C3G0U4_CHRPI
SVTHLVSLISRDQHGYSNAAYNLCMLLPREAVHVYLSGRHGPLVQSALSSHPLVCLRIQINPQNKGDFQGISPERAFADFLFASTILHLVVINFVG